MRVRSIRTRLTLWYTSLLALTFLMLGGIAYLMVAYTLYEDTDSSLKSVAIALAEKHKTEFNGGLPPDVNEIFRHFFGPVPIEPYFEWLDREGRVRREFNEPSGIPFTPAAKQNAVAGIATYETVTGTGPYPMRILTWPVVELGRVTAIIRVGMSRMSLYKTISRFLLIMAVLFPLALALAGGGGWLFAHRALLPIDRMTETARKISGEALHNRLELTGAGDELDRLADTLNSMLSRLDETFAEMRQFTADASHELQTPLTILRGEIEVALRSIRSPDEYIRILKSALEEVERISALVEGLLLLARSDAGVLKMDCKAVDLVALAEDILGQVSSLATKRSVSLRLGNIEPIEIMGDPMHLRRLFLNLLDNGIKYTPSGGTVKLSIERRNEWAVVTVEDTGQGIPNDEKEKIFQRFYRSAEARSGGQGGSGLGLSIVDSIVKAHNGAVGLESSPGKGATFRICLPLRPGR